MPSMLTFLLWHSCVQALTVLVHAEEGAVLQAEDNIKQQVRQLENEKLQMTAANMIDDEVLNLNVGGQHMSVKRSTLTQVGHSLQVSIYVSISNTDLGGLIVTACISCTAVSANQQDDFALLHSKPRNHQPPLTCHVHNSSVWLCKTCTQAPQLNSANGSAA